MTNKNDNRRPARKPRREPKYLRINKQGIPVIMERKGKPTPPNLLDWEHYGSA